MTGETCACGIFAIGLCSACQRPVCGVHGKVFEGRLTCLEDIQDIRHRAAQAAEQQRTAEELDQDESAMEELLALVRAEPDGISRWLRSLNANWWDGETGHLPDSASFNRHESLVRCANAVADLVNEVEGGDRIRRRLGTAPPQWIAPMEDLVAWATARCQPDKVVHAGAFRRLKGWEVGRGTDYTSDYRNSSSFSYWLFLSTEGRIYKVGEGQARIKSWHFSAPLPLTSNVGYLRRFL